MDWDVVVIGAGPAGCFTATEIARAGFKVLVIEEHENIGLPVQCSGLISPRAMELAGVDESIVMNNLKGMHVLSPLGADLYIKSDNILAHAVDRTAFDKALAAKAENAGAIITTGKKVERIERISGGFYLNASDIAIKTKLIIGADGVYSDVAAWLKLKSNNRKAVMFAADVKLKMPDTGLMSIFLGHNFAPGWFGWIIPINSDTCRVGTGYAFFRSDYSPRHYFQKLIDSYPQVFSGLEIIRYTGGIIPLNIMSKIYTSNAMLVGDAACQTKPISGGGIYLGLRGAQLCGKTAVEALRDGDLSEEKMSGYQKLWEKEMGDEIKTAMKLRESYLSIKDKDIDRIIRLLNKAKCHEMIIKNGDIDFPSQIAKKLISIIPWKDGIIRNV